MKLDGNDRATLIFDHVGGGLVAKDGDLAGFTVAGEDNVFHPAKATIKDDTVVVTCDKVEKIDRRTVRVGELRQARRSISSTRKGCRRVRSAPTTCR